MKWIIVAAVIITLALGGSHVLTPGKGSVSNYYSQLEQNCR